MIISKIYVSDLLLCNLLQKQRRSAFYFFGCLFYICMRTKYIDGIIKKYFFAQGVHRECLGNEKFMVCISIFKQMHFIPYRNYKTILQGKWWHLWIILVLCCNCFTFAFPFIGLKLLFIIYANYWNITFFFKNFLLQFTNWNPQNGCLVLFVLIYNIDNSYWIFKTIILNHFNIFWNIF